MKAPIESIWFEASEWDQTTGPFRIQVENHTTAQHIRAQLYKLRKEWQKNIGDTPYDSFVIRITGEDKNILTIEPSLTIDYTILPPMKPPEPT